MEIESLPEDNQTEIDDNDIIEDNFDFSDNLSESEINLDSDDDEELECPDKHDFSSFNIISNNNTYLDYVKREKKTKPYLTKFELTKIIGCRATQIENGAPTLLKHVPKNIRDSKSIAELEFENKLVPFMIRRYLPNGTFEDWKITDFLNYN